MIRKLDKMMASSWSLRYKFHPLCVQNTQIISEIFEDFSFNSVRLVIRSFFLMFRYLSSLSSLYQLFLVNTNMFSSIHYS